MEDKRKVLSSARLEHLAKMREKAAEKRKQTALAKEQQAKTEVLSEIAEDTEPIEPEEPIQKEVRRKPTRQTPEPVYQNHFSLSDEDVKVVKSFVQIERERRKAEKWNARKKEILDEVLNIFDG